MASRSRPRSAAYIDRLFPQTVLIGPASSSLCLLRLLTRFLRLPARRLRRLIRRLSLLQGLIGGALGFLDVALACAGTQREHAHHNKDFRESTIGREHRPYSFLSGSVKINSPSTISAEIVGRKTVGRGHPTEPYCNQNH